MTKEQALEMLRDQYHRTRTTWAIAVEPEIIAALLGYNYKTRYYENRKEQNEESIS